MKVSQFAPALTACCLAVFAVVSCRQSVKQEAIRARQLEQLQRLQEQINSLQEQIKATAEARKRLATPARAAPVASPGTAPEKPAGAAPAAP